MNNITREYIIPTENPERWNAQCRALEDIQSWYPLGWDVEDGRYSRAKYAAEKTGLQIDECYNLLRAIDMDNGAERY